MHLATVETSTVIASGAKQSKTYFSHTDHLGGGNILTDINAEQVQTLDYYPFGEVRVDEQYQDFDETKKFTGHELDDSTGLIYAQARYYDPEIGRFISEDPLGWRQGELMERFSGMPQAFNAYSYTVNNPIILVDPQGEWVETFWDVVNTVVDAGVVVKNVAEIGYNDAKFLAGAVTGNETIKTEAVEGLKHDLGELGWGAVDVAADSAATLIPFVPAGLTKGLRAVDDVAATASDIKKIGNKAPDFVVGPKGTVYPVPKNSVGPIDVVNKNKIKTGSAFVDGKGGANGRVNEMRIMNPNQKNPEGYIKYEKINSDGSRQGVNPYSGKTTTREKSHNSLK